MPETDEATDGDGTDGGSSSSRRATFEAGLSTEYFALQGARSSTIGEAGTRATLFFTTLTGTLIALGFVAGSGADVRTLAYSALPVVGIVGLLSYLRLVELSIEDVRALEAINRIRAYYAATVPEGPEFFPAPRQGQAVNTVVATGARSGRWQILSTMASTVGIAVSLFLGLLVGYAVLDASGRPVAGVAVGAAAALAVAVLLLSHQERRFVQALGLPRRRTPVGR